MVRLRTLVRAIAAASVLTSGMAHGLGLGEITLKSALNQPLDAEIELLEVRDLGSGEVIPSLASPEEFSKAGVDRLYYLTDLKFTPVVKPNGKSVIRVTSSKPVQEPYLNFLVQVSGRTAACCASTPSCWIRRCTPRRPRQALRKRRSARRA